MVRILGNIFGSIKVIVTPLLVTGGQGAVGAAYRYGRVLGVSIPGVTTAVLGCRNIRQVESNCELIEQTVPLTKAQLSMLHEAFANTDPRVTNPGLWFNHT